MSTRLIIEGNAVYEIDEDCRGCGRRYGYEQTEEKEGDPEENEKKHNHKSKLENSIQLS